MSLGGNRKLFKLQEENPVISALLDSKGMYK